MRPSDWLRACQTQFRRHLTIAVLSSAVNVLYNDVKERTEDFQLFRSHRARTMVEPCTQMIVYKITCFVASGRPDYMALASLR